MPLKSAVKNGHVCIWKLTRSGSDAFSVKVAIYMKFIKSLFWVWKAENPYICMAPILFMGPPHMPVSVRNDVCLVPTVAKELKLKMKRTPLIRGGLHKTSTGE